MGRGSSGGGGASGGVNPNNIRNAEDMISARNDQNKKEVDAVLNVAKNMTKKFGNDVAIEGTFQLADFVGKDAGTLGCYSHDGDITMNKKYVGNKNLNSVYDKCVTSGFHPSRGKKSGVEAVAAHEYGHSLTANVQKSMGENDFGTAATRIVTEARKSTGSKSTNKAWRSKISGYSNQSDIEAIAEACADVYCNGKSAKSESHAIFNTMSNYLKKKTK